MSSPAMRLLDGAIDTHAHTAPALFRRDVDDLQLAELVTDYKMRGFVLKDHDMSTTGRAYHVNKQFPKVHAISTVVLNRSVGGINPYVAQSAIHYGARVVFMPSNHAKHHEEYFNIPDYPQFGRPKKQLPGHGVTVFDHAGNLTPETLTILDVCAAENVAIATGHLSLEEIRSLLAAANERGVQKFIVTHANWSLSKLELSVQRELVDAGAWLEYVACTIASPIFREQEPKELASWIDQMGTDRLILGSDLGSVPGPAHPEGLRMVLEALLAEGVRYDDLERMTKQNPVTVFGLEE